MAFNVKELINDLNNIDLSEIRADNIGSWPLAVRIIACLLAMSLAIGGYWYLRVMNMSTTLDLEIGKEVELRAQFTQRAFEAANLQAYRLQLQELELRLATLISQLPTDTEVPGLLEDITGTGLGSGLTIESITLRPETTHDYYIELPISIVASGGYHDFATFVSGVAGLPRIVTLHDFEIRNTGRASMTMNIEAKTYRYRDASR